MSNVWNTKPHLTVSKLYSHIWAFDRKHVQIMHELSLNSPSTSSLLFCEDQEQQAWATITGIGKRSFKNLLQPLCCRNTIHIRAVCLSIECFLAKMPTHQKFWSNACLREWLCFAVQRLVGKRPHANPDGCVAGRFPRKCCFSRFLVLSGRLILGKSPICVGIEPYAQFGWAMYTILIFATIPHDQIWVRLSACSTWLGIRVHCYQFWFMRIMSRL